MNKKPQVELYVDRVSGRTLYKRTDWWSALVNNNPTISYFKDPELKILHREDGPAIVVEGVHMLWLANNEPHRMGGPAYYGAFVNNKYTRLQWIVSGTYIFALESDGSIARQLV